MSYAAKQDFYYDYDSEEDPECSLASPGNVMREPNQNTFNTRSPLNNNPVLNEALDSNILDELPKLLNEVKSLSEKLITENFYRLISSGISPKYAVQYLKVMDKYCLGIINLEEATNELKKINISKEKALKLLMRIKPNKNGLFRSILNKLFR